MPTITGLFTLPGDNSPLTGTWSARIATADETGIVSDTDGSLRGGVETATDLGDGATMTLPVGWYDFTWESLVKVNGQRVHFGPVRFNLSTNTTWGAIRDAAPGTGPITPTQFEQLSALIGGQASASRVTKLETTSATVEDLVGQSGIFTQSVTGSMVVFIPGFPCRIIAASLVVYGNSGGMIAANDTDYWDLRICRNRAGAGNAFAIKTTKVTGGQAITHRVAWNYSTVSFDSTYRDLDAGDIVTIEMYKNGNPNPLTNLMVSVRYSPL